MIIEAGQVAVVTGAAQGLGRALAAGLVDRCVSVALADTAEERLRDTAEAFTAGHDGAAHWGDRGLSRIRTHATDRGHVHPAPDR
ncbi:MAG: SDR family NAD(P)-dependent oxidoreductase [Pseudonocardiaceae bacterium]